MNRIRPINPNSPNPVSVEIGVNCEVAPFFIQIRSSSPLGAPTKTLVHISVESHFSRRNTRNYVVVLHRCFSPTYTFIERSAYSMTVTESNGAGVKYANVNLTPDATPYDSVRFQDIVRQLEEVENGQIREVAPAIVASTALSSVNNDLD